jgi:hypothetical protein
MAYLAELAAHVAGTHFEDNDDEHHIGQILQFRLMHDNVDIL